MRKIDIVDIKKYVKNKTFRFYIKDGYIYCEDTKTHEIVSVGNYACMTWHPTHFEIIKENGERKTIQRNDAVYNGVMMNETTKKIKR